MYSENRFNKNYYFIYLNGKKNISRVFISRKCLFIEKCKINFFLARIIETTTK